nr:MAG TPA: hypothetical protein [Caudoviricetes sp.]
MLCKCHKCYSIFFGRGLYWFLFRFYFFFEQGGIYIFYFWRFTFIA